jgi:hypothetical protein
VKAFYIVGLYLVACEAVEYLLTRGRGADVFPPKLGFRIVRWLGLAACLVGIWSARRSLNWTVILLAFAIVALLRWPRSVFADSLGVSSSGLFGLFRRSIPWAEVSRVTSDWQEEDVRFWTLTGYAINVIGRDGTVIQHGLVNKNQGRFLDALRRLIPRTAFDAGLYDWQPDAPAENAR